MLEDIAIFDGVGDIYFDPPDMPILRAPTTLYGIEPIGIGTGACESLRSYIIRLADAHRVSPSILVRDIVTIKMVGQPGHWIAKRKLVFKTHPVIVSGSASSQTIYSALSTLTGSSNLDCCTLIPVSKILCAQRLLKKSQFHCPKCIQSTNHIDSMYGRLIWEIQCVTACHIHGIKLIESKCGSIDSDRLHEQHRKILPGICSRCGSVGYRCRDHDISPASEIEIWKAKQISELISYFPKAKYCFSQQQLSAGLRALATFADDGMYSVTARKAGIHKSVLWGWINEQFNPNLKQLLSLCLLNKISLVSLFEGFAVPCDCPIVLLEPTPSLKIPKIYAQARKDALEIALNADLPQSLTAVANSLNLNSKTLKNQFPNLTKSIINRFKEYQKKENLVRHEQYLSQGKKMIGALSARQMTLTNRNFQTITRQTLGPSSPLWMAIKHLILEDEVI